MDQRQSISARYRSKRARYAPRACAECQRRKIRCDGNQPCVRCSTQSFQCLYTGRSSHSTGRPSFDTHVPRHTTRHLSTSDEVLVPPSNGELPGASTPVRSSTSASRSQAPDRPWMDHLPSAPPGESPEFCGPSSTEFTFNTAVSNLRNTRALRDTCATLANSRSSSTRFAQYGPFMKLLTTDPLWDVSRDEAITLVEDWCFGLGDVYPIVEREATLQTVSNVFDAMESAGNEGLKESGGLVAEALFDHDTNKLKLILAIGLTKGTGGRNHLAERLFQSTSEAVEGLLWNAEGIHGIQLLYLAAMYHYHLNEEVRTGRAIAFAARLCLETGLHQRSSIEKGFPDHRSRVGALQAFWAVYMLERRLSLGQGIPFTIQDSFLDPSLLTTADYSNLLLPKLLEWTRLAGKTWYALNSCRSTTFSDTTKNVRSLDHEILQWYASLPENWRLSDATSHPKLDEKSRYYQSVFFVRESHLRCLIYRPIFQSSTHIRHNTQLFWHGIGITKETIRTLVHLDDTTALVRTHPLFFQQLLLTAFGNLLLAITHAPSESWASVRSEFDMVLVLFKFLASKCTALRRTWQRLQGLRDLHAKLTQVPQQQQQQISTTTATTTTTTTTTNNGSKALRNQESRQQSDIAALSFEDIFPRFPTFATTHPDDGAPRSVMTTGREQASNETTAPPPLTGPSDDNDNDHDDHDVSFPNLDDELMTGSDNFFDFPFVDLGPFQDELLV